MGQSSQHPGHKAEAWAKIEKAREHYRTRAERRRKQVWTLKALADIEESEKIRLPWEVPTRGQEA